MRVRAVWVDTDGADQAPIKAAYPDLIVESSPGNFHDYWLVEGCPLDEFRWAQKTLSEVWGTDAGVKDLSRVMRLPGFPHQKVDSKKGLTGNKFMVRMVATCHFWALKAGLTGRNKLINALPTNAPPILPRLSRNVPSQAFIRLTHVTQQRLASPMWEAPQRTRRANCWATSILMCLMTNG